MGIGNIKRLNYYLADCAALEELGFKSLLTIECKLEAVLLALAAFEFPSTE